MNKPTVKVTPDDGRGWVFYLRECFEYDEDRGVLTWKERPCRHFKTPGAQKYFNSRFSGKRAGTHETGMKRYSYWSVQVDGKKYKLHRIAWAIYTGSYPDARLQIDHIDGNTSNNSISNLRLVDQSGNQRNLPRRSDSTTGATGVSFHKGQNRYHAFIKHDGRQIHLGSFITKNQAVEARKHAESRFGYHENHGRVCRQQAEEKS